MLGLRRLIPGRGDVNSFFGLVLDNIADLILVVVLLRTNFGFPVSFALTHMVPGTTIGVLIGDVAFYVMARRLARRTGRPDVTAMPLGLDTPSTFGMSLLVIGPAYVHAQKTLGLAGDEAATYAWHIGIGAIFVSGLVKLAVAPAANWVRRVVPRAGLLGSLAAIALVLIGFLPLAEILAVPILGLVCFWLIQANLLGRVALPGGVPGTLAVLVLGSAMVYGYAMAVWAGGGGVDAASLPGVFSWDWGRIAAGGGVAAWAESFPRQWVTALTFGWVARLPDLVAYLPIVIPFALLTVLGGIDCTESAAAVGDEYDTRAVVGVEGAATLIAALCGGVIQTTPYIGHPAYKAMGGRTAYVLAVAIVVGAAGLLGFFQVIFDVVPKVTILPILVFIGLEITAQSFHATPRRHYGAVALACLPAMAKVIALFVGQVVGDLVGTGRLAGELDVSPRLQETLIVLRTLSGGFVLTGLLWASAMVAILDRRFARAAAFLAVCALASLCGLMHSPLSGDQAFIPSWPGAEATASPDVAPAAGAETTTAPPADATLEGGFLVGPPRLTYLPWRFAAGYALVAALVAAWGAWRRYRGTPDEWATEPGPDLRPLPDPGAPAETR